MKGEEEVWVKGERREDNIIVQDKGRRGGMWVKGEKERGGGKEGEEVLRERLQTFMHFEGRTCLWMIKILNVCTLQGTPLFALCSNL